MSRSGPPRLPTPQPLRPFVATIVLLSILLLFALIWIGMTQNMVSHAERKAAKEADKAASLRSENSELRSQKSAAEFEVSRLTRKLDAAKTEIERLSRSPN